MSLRTRTTAAYKGIISIIFRNSAKDFLANNSMSSSAAYADSIDIHHIFPKKYCAAKGIPKARYDNIANKTLILKNTNRTIGGDPPSVYLKRIENSANVEEILERHFIDAELCRADNFDAFLVDRAKKILDKVEELTGRKVAGRDSQDIVKTFGAKL